ncbi:multicopper oxidase family protein [Archangium lipolyticum]|uniref:multicopper oxidase family protein n=1 Tax=Archangium lipolyticum TaxID=2970465 RepID=UPI00214A483E|nr:multicopper oxidase family protein [Archangium lipolyticum]
MALGLESKRIGEERERRVRAVCHPTQRWLRTLWSYGLLLLTAGVLAGPVASAAPKKPRPWPWPQPTRDISQQLEVKYATNRICRVMEQGICKEWDIVKLRSYNGGLVGPTIEVRPGDTLHVLLENHLPPELQPPPSDPNIPHGFNTTNLHTHGLHVSPVGNSDNVLLAISPHQKFEFEIKIPADHPAGTFWYHPHKHGSVALQVSSGLAGALIVRGDIDEVPEIKAAQEKIFLFQQIPYALINDPYEPGKQANMVESAQVFIPGRWEQSGLRTLINGEFLPTFKMRAGEVQRWRFIHGGTMESLHLRLVRENEPQTVMNQYQIAHDGITTGRLDEVQETEMFPGYRVDVMVRAGLGPETWLLVDEASPPERSLNGVAETRKVLARIVVEGRSVVPMPLPEEKALEKLVPFEPIKNEELTGEQRVAFSFDLSVNPPKFLINGKPFDPNAPPRRLELGAAERWIVSSSPIQGHPFHIHVNPFQVVLGNGKDIWKDTLFVGPEQTFELRTRYERYIGRFVMHCHILDHEDLGMMELQEVVLPGSMGGHHPN